MLQGAEVNLHWKDGNFAGNAVSSASINLVTMNMLRHIAQNNGVVTDDNLRMIQELVYFLPKKLHQYFPNRVQEAGCRGDPFQ